MHKMLWRGVDGGNARGGHADASTDLSSLPSELVQHAWSFCDARSLTRLRRTHTAAHAQVDVLAQGHLSRDAASSERISINLPGLASSPQSTQFRLRLLAASEDGRLLQEVWLLLGWEIDVTHTFSQIFHPATGGDAYISYSQMSSPMTIDEYLAITVFSGIESAGIVPGRGFHNAARGFFLQRHHHNGHHSGWLVGHFDNACHEANHRNLRVAQPHCQGLIASRYSAKGELLPVLLDVPLLTSQPPPRQS